MVAHGVAVRVVHILEVVQIEEEEYLQVNNIYKQQAAQGSDTSSANAPEDEEENFDAYATAKQHFNFDRKNVSKSSYF